MGMLKTDHIPDNARYGSGLQKPGSRPMENCPGKRRYGSYFIYLKKNCWISFICTENRSRNTPEAAGRLQQSRESQ